MLGKFVSKLIQSLPTWEVTKYYGRVCMYQLKCLKYKVQTSEAWFNFKCKFMPGSLRNELECEDMIPKKKVKEDQSTQKKVLKKESDTISQKKKTVILDAKKKKSQSSIFFNDEDNSCISDEFKTTTKSKKTLEKKKSEDDKCSMQDDYATRKPRKVKQARQ